MLIWSTPDGGRHLCSLSYSVPKQVLSDLFPLTSWDLGRPGESANGKPPCSHMVLVIGSLWPQPRSTPDDMSYCRNRQRIVVTHNLQGPCCYWIFIWFLKSKKYIYKVAHRDTHTHQDNQDSIQTKGDNPAVNCTVHFCRRRGVGEVIKPLTHVPCSVECSFPL